MNDRPTPDPDATRASAAFDRITVAARRATDLGRALDLLAFTWTDARWPPSYIAAARKIVRAAETLRDKTVTANGEQFGIMARENSEPWSVLADEAEAMADGAEKALSELAALVAEHAPALAVAAPVKGAEAAVRDRQERAVAAVLSEHTDLTDRRACDGCSCGEQGEDGYPAHVAALIVTALTGKEA